jgi:uncharacterized protein (TIGR03437 family)
MSGPRKLDLNRSLEAYFATLRHPSPDDARRRAGNWHIYAAVTGSALAMATGASAALINDAVTTPPVTLSSPQLPTADATPAISPNGIVPLYSTVNIIQPGEWISIYGTNLASTTATWDGTFQTTLGGVSVQINGKAAYMMYVSPGQINVQAPDDTATGTVPVIVTTPLGTVMSTVTLAQASPSFSLLASKHVAGIILRPKRTSGNPYDILGPSGKTFGYATVAARVGDTVSLYGVGFGPTTPTVPAGKAYTGAAPINDSFSLYLNNVLVKPSFVGMSSAGLYQINLVVPAGVGEGDVPLVAYVNGVQTQTGVLFSLEHYASGSSSGGVGGGGTSAGPPFSFGPGGTGWTGGTPGWGGTGGPGGTGGGGGTGGSAHRGHRRSYTPKLKYPPKPASPSTPPAQ